MKYEVKKLNTLQSLGLIGSVLLHLYKQIETPLLYAVIAGLLTLFLVRG